jgi:hypothetical protein
MMKYVAPEIVDFRWMEGMGSCKAGSLAVGDSYLSCIADGNTANGLNCSPGGTAESYCRLDGNAPSIGRCSNGPAESP